MNRVAPDEAAASWLVAVDERCYGPYRLDQLASFLKPDHWVFHPSLDDWRVAKNVASLAEVLAGNIEPAIDWYYRNPGKKEQGPLTREAIINLTKSGMITSNSLIRHESWKEGQQILETPFAEELEIREMWLSNRLRKSARFDSRREARRDKPSRGLSPAQAGIRNVVGIVAIAALAGVAWQLTGNFSKPSLIRECGYPDGNCQTSKSSRCVCATTPMACGCMGSTRGQCEMKSCVEAARKLGM